MRGTRWRSGLLVLLAIAVLVTSAALGRSISIEEAAAVAPLAARTLLPAGMKCSDAEASDRAAVVPLLDSSGIPLAYVAPLLPSGYLVLSADTRLPVVVCFSLSEDSSTASASRSPLREMILLDLERRHEALAREGLSVVSPTRSSASWEMLLQGGQPQERALSEAPIGPLIEAPSWSQGPPWDNLCPVDPATQEKSVPGCVAIALGQILSFWRHPSQIAFTSADDYRTPTRSLPVSATRASVALIEYGERSWRNPDDLTMAAIAFAAGVSVQMDYTSERSGARLTDVAVALAGSTSPYTTEVRGKTWGYESAEVRTCVQVGWGAPYAQSVSDFFSDIRKDLREGRPTLLCITNTSHGAGHVVICDGYDPVLGTYHINMGWGGASDAWYALPDDVPGGYNIVEYGVLRIVPGHASDADAGSPHGSSPQPAYSPYAVTASAFPNPTGGPVTFLPVGLPRGEELSLRVDVFSLAGDLVWTAREAGVSEITWDGVASDGQRAEAGVYIYTLSISCEAAPAIRVRGKLFVTPDG